MKYLVYTTVFGGYDRVFPPVEPDPQAHYLILTDAPGLQVPGWRTEAVNISGFPTTKAANLYYRALIHRLYAGYDVSVYVDGNIRILHMLADIVAPFLASNAALGVFTHPHRASVKEEILACIASSKTANPERMHDELARYTAEGFMDDCGLVETGIMLKNHAALDLDAAMELWNAQYQQHLTRDQISLPYVFWKTGVSRTYQSFSFRDKNRWFGLYPHRGAGHVRSGYADLCARSYDSFPHWITLKAWHSVRGFRRGLRQLGMPI